MFMGGRYRGNSSEELVIAKNAATWQSMRRFKSVALRAGQNELDCRVAALLAMTKVTEMAWIAPSGNRDSP
jgi:hypothetical protein